MFISLWVLFREHAEIVGLALFNGFPLALSPGFSTMGERRVSIASSLGFRTKNCFGFQCHNFETLKQSV